MHEALRRLISWETVAVFWGEVLHNTGLSPQKPGLWVSREKMLFIPLFCNRQGTIKVTKKWSEEIVCQPEIIRTDFWVEAIGWWTKWRKVRSSGDPAVWRYTFRHRDIQNFVGNDREALVVLFLPLEPLLLTWEPRFAFMTPLIQPFCTRLDTF